MTSHPTSSNLLTEPPGNEGDSIASITEVGEVGQGDYEGTRATLLVSLAVAIADSGCKE